MTVKTIYRPVNIENAVSSVDVHHNRHPCCNVLLFKIIRMFFSEKKLELKSMLLKLDTKAQRFIQRMLSSGRK